LVLFPLRRRGFQPRCQLDLKDGVSLTAPVDEPLLPMFRDIWMDRCYAPRDGRPLPSGTIIDVGANVGVFALWAATHYPGARILAVEPSPRSCRFLRENIARSRLDNVMVLQGACGGEPGDAVLYTRGPEAMNSLYARDNYGSHFRPLASTTVFTLDDLFAQFNIHTCSLLKLDCEGAEYEILFNAKAETLRRIESIAMEYHVGLNEHSGEELEEFLRAHNFDVKRLPLYDPEGGYLYAVRLA